ncbi:Glycosyl transferase, family 43 [Artemisia annua]|uniref:Glycosyl transferase, family 43 n=1 Tax=Artemisia annua TaxID=35608 RepID=A0A2U1QNK5_ARTAN|nr:Glycosyl transferase, family 43 [Artemisia annua]
MVEPLGGCGKKVMMWWLRSEARAYSKFPVGLVFIVELIFKIAKFANEGDRYVDGAVLAATSIIYVAEISQDWFVLMEFMYIAGGTANKDPFLDFKHNHGKFMYICWRTNFRSDLTPTLVFLYDRESCSWWCRCHIWNAYCFYNYHNAYDHI